MFVNFNIPNQSTMPVFITSKTELKQLTANAVNSYEQSGLDAGVNYIHTHILLNKVRFPLLEECARQLYMQIPKHEHNLLCDRIVALHEMGGNVLVAVLLQQELGNKPEVQLNKALNYIIKGNEWYVCDIIGERVQGYTLLHFPEVCLPVLQKMTQHPDKWAVRAVGVATHYAVKKGLQKKYVEQAFLLLLSQSHATEFHTRKGIGWAAKTIAKFYPDIIQQYRERLDNDPSVKQWFKTKINIGLGRSFKYADKYTG